MNFGKKSKPQSHALMEALLKSLFATPDIYLMSIDQKLEYLKENLPVDLGPHFRKKAFSLSTNCKAEAINKLEEFILEEQIQQQKFETFLDILELLVVVGPIHTPVPAFDYLDWLQNIDEDLLMSVTDEKDILMPQLEKLALNHNLKNIALLAKLLLKRFSSILENTQETQETLKSIFLEQAPPSLASFRGLIGNDCSSCRSFPYPYDDNELVFFLYLEQQNNQPRSPIGYVSATLKNIESSNEKALYVHTIAGSGVTQAQGNLF